MDTSIIDVPLPHLPLRPSSLDTLTIAGFERVAEVCASYRSGGVVNFAAELSVSTTLAHSIYREVIQVATGTSSSSFSSESILQNRCDPSQLQSCHTAAALLQVQRGRRFHGHDHIITFCRALDEILSGGIAIGELTEISGGPGTGKTALSMQLAVNAALPVAVSGVAGSTIYIDTEGSFSPERCHYLAAQLISHTQAGLRRRQKQQASSHVECSGTNSQCTNWNVSADDILSNIHIFRTHDVSDMVALISGELPNLIEQLATSSHPVRLVVIDSVAFPYRAADPDSTDFMARTRQLTATATNLSLLASTYQLAVVAINQMTTKFTSSSTEGSGRGGTILVPALGESWAHAVTTRLVLSYESQKRRVCSLTKSPRLPSGSALFEIVEAGVRGIEYTSAKKHRTSD